MDDETDLGYVEDGTPCGPSMMCLDRKCLPIQSLNMSTCPTGPNGQVCSAHGVSPCLTLFSKKNFLICVKMLTIVYYRLESSAFSLGSLVQSNLSVNFQLIVGSLLLYVM